MYIVEQSDRLTALRQHLTSTASETPMADTAEWREEERQAGVSRGFATNGPPTWGLEEVSQPKTSHVLRATNAALNVGHEDNAERGSNVDNFPRSSRTSGAPERRALAMERSAEYDVERGGTSGYDSQHDSRATSGYNYPDRSRSTTGYTTVSYTHLTLPTIYSV